MMYYSNDPAADADRRERDWDEFRETHSIGECIQCGEPILAGDDFYEGEEYIETEDGLVHWECWTDYGRDKKEKA